MPRIAGQIDIAKNEAILDAAAAALTERGLAAPLEEIARRAGVSKQTIYNHYGSKSELVRTLIQRRVERMTAVLQLPGASEHPEAALAAFARAMLDGLLSHRSSVLMRITIQGASDLPDLAAIVYEAGPLASRRRLAQFLSRETAAGRLAVDDPEQASEFFIGMLGGPFQAALLLGIKGRSLDEAGVDKIARAAASRFVRAYAP
jgi:AcrR family transcriptional regulator